MLHHRLLIGFLDMFLCNAVKKFLTFKRHLTNHIKHFVSLFLCIFYFVEQIKKHVTEIKDLDFLSTHFFLKKNSYKGLNNYDVHADREWGDLCF